jgi:tRNA-2-methylthio-N6-dimethylallyladenosine synthase
MSYMFFVNDQGTLAERRYKDDVPLDVKKRDCRKCGCSGQIVAASNKKDIGKHLLC